jgi:predicted transcriptional regulator
MLGAMAGVSGSYISIILKGQRVPTLITARRILKALGEHGAADSL